METKKSVANLLAMAIVASFSVYGADDDGDASHSILESYAQEAETARAIDFARAPIKSDADPRRHLAERDIRSPLDQLSPGAKRRFIASLAFKEKGLTTFDYSDLRGRVDGESNLRCPCIDWCAAHNISYSRHSHPQRCGSRDHDAWWRLQEYAPPLLCGLPL